MGVAEGEAVGVIVGVAEGDEDGCAVGGAPIQIINRSAHKDHRSLPVGTSVGTGVGTGVPEATMNGMAFVDGF